MDRASVEQVSMSNEEICSTHCLLRTGTLTNTVYEVNNSTAALPEQLLTRAIYSGISHIYSRNEYPDREGPAVFYVNFPTSAGPWSNVLFLLMLCNSWN